MLTDSTFHDKPRNGPARRRDGHKPLTIAVAKGRMLEATAELLARAGLPAETLLDTASRRLVRTAGDITYLILKPADVATYVEQGVADLGIAGRDSLAESRRSIIELEDLAFGRCQMVVAGPQPSARKSWLEGKALTGRPLRVATKYPRVASDFFNQGSRAAKVIPLHGNIELAPLMGLADLVVDIVQTGRTLRENGLEVVEEIFTSTARLVSSATSLQIKNSEIVNLAGELARAAGEGVDIAGR